MNQDKQLIQSIVQHLVKGGKEFIEEIQKGMFLFGEIVTQIKGSDEETQKQFYQFLCQFSFFISKLVHFPEANEMEIIQHIDLPNQKEMLSIFVKDFFSVIKKYVKTQKSFVEEFCLFFISTVFDFLGKYKNIMFSFCLCQAFIEANKQLEQSFYSQQMSGMSNLQEMEEENKQEERKEINSSDKQLQSSQQMEEETLEIMNNQDNNNQSSKTMQIDHQQTFRESQISEIPKIQSKSFPTLSHINLTQPKPQIQTLQTTKSNESNPIIIEDESELEYDTTQPKNKMISTQSKPLSQSKTLQKEEELKTTQQKTRNSQSNQLTQSQQNATMEMVFDCDSFESEPEEYLENIETKEKRQSKQLKDKENKEMKDTKEIRLPKELKELEIDRKPTFANITDEKRELLLQTNSYQFQSVNDGSVVFQIRQRLLKKLDCSYDSCFYSITDISMASTFDENMFYDVNALTDTLLSCEIERKQTKTVKSNVYSYKQAFTDDYQFIAEKQILLQRGIRINSYKITVSKHTKIKYYPLIIGLRREYLLDQHLSHPDEPIIIPIKIIKTIKPKYYYFFYNIYDQGNVHDMIAVEVYSK